MNRIFALEGADFREIRIHVPLHGCSLLAGLSERSGERGTGMPERALPVSCCVSWRPGAWR